MPDSQSSLAGKRVLVLRPTGGGEELSQMLRVREANVIDVEAIQILPPSSWDPVDDALRRAGEFDWVTFTTSAGVEAVFERAREIGLKPVLPGHQVAALGTVTAAALAGYRIPVDWIPQRYTPEDIAEDFPGNWATVCLWRSGRADQSLEQNITNRGFKVHRVSAYQTNPIAGREIKSAMKQDPDAVVYTSRSLIESYLKAVGPKPRKAIICCIGPATTQSCRDAGLNPQIESFDHTLGGMVDAMEEYFAPR